MTKLYKMLLYAERARSAEIHQHQCGGNVQNRESKQHRRKKAAAHLYLQAGEAKQIHGGMDSRKQRILGFQAFGIGLEDVVKAQVVRGEQKREQKKRGTEQGKIRGENTGAADEAEAGRRKAQRARYKPVVQGYARRRMPKLRRMTFGLRYQA